MTAETKKENNLPEDGGIPVVCPYRLAIFDLDGTVLDTLDDLADAVNYALRKAGYPERSRSEIRGFLGNGMRNLIQQSVGTAAAQTMQAAPAGTAGGQADQSARPASAGTADFGDDWNRVFDLFVPRYEDHCREKTRPYDGIPEMLHAVRRAGVKTALISNKADAPVQLLIRDFFPGMFDYVTGERKNVRRKPAPDEVDACLEELGIRRQDAVYIGDSEVDIETAENAGMDGLIVAWGFRDAPRLRKEIRRSPHAAALRLVETPEELTEILTGNAEIL